MLALMNRLFGNHESSRDVAKRRLQLVLVHDRSSVSPELMEKLRTELIGVISKYMEIDESGLEVGLEQSGTEMVALVANIPVREVRRS